MNLNSGQSVELLGGNQKHRLPAGAIGRIVTVIQAGHTTVYSIDFDGLRVELPGGWLKPVQPKASERRPPLFLHAPKDERDEASRQTEGKNFLESHGYFVVEIAKTRKGQPCPKCQHFVTPKGYQGTTPGTPDMAISHPNYPGTPHVVLFVEWKKRPWTTESKPIDDREEEQMKWLQCGRAVGAWDLPSLCLAVTRFEESLGIEPLDDLLEKLL